MVCIMISRQEHFGQAKYLEILEDTDIYFGRFRVWNVAATDSGLSVILPAINNLPLGGPVFYIINSGDRRILIKDSGGNPVGRIEINEAAIIMRSSRWK